MGFSTVTELPLVLHQVERDPFLDSTGSDRTGDMATAAGAELPVDVEELRVRSRHAELAA
jgi:hypothetical protein